MGATVRSDTDGGRLLVTKLHAPRRRPGIVSRGRLSDQLAAGADRSLTVVSAPAGFGKTTLLAEWAAAAAEHGAVTAWLSLEASDSNPATFWTYVVGALRAALPGVGDAAGTMLREGHSWKPVVASLVDDLVASAAEIALVLDDYHAIDSPAVHESLAFLVERVPATVRVVVAGRADPPLPLARLRARRELLEIRAADLRFTHDEAAAYLNESMGLGLAAADVGQLESRTEGWIAALQLAALSMQERDDVDQFISTFTGDDRFVVDYLIEEVLDHLAADVRAFLLRTCVLDRLTGALCDAVTGGPGGREMLARLERSNLFLVPLDDRRRWYRYHHLFADMLRARLLADDPGIVAELHARASSWHEAAGDPVAAIEHAMAGGSFSEAARLIETSAPAMNRLRQEATLRRWLEALPAQLFADRPVLALILAGTRMATGDTTGVAELLHLAERSAGEGAGAPPIVHDLDELRCLPAQVCVYRAGLALLAGDPDGTVAHAERALTLTEEQDHLRRGAASALIGLALWSGGELEDAEGRYSAALASFLASDFVADVLGVALGLADIQVARGRLTSATRTLESALRHADRHGRLRGTADIHVALAEIDVDRGDLDDAERRLRLVDGLGGGAGLPQNPYRRLVARARLLGARGDAGSALEALAAAELVYDTDFSPPVRPIPAVTARMHLGRGEPDAARRSLSALEVTAHDQLAYVREYAHLTLAWILVAECRVRRDPTEVAAAIALVDRLLDAARSGDREPATVEALAVRAELLLLAGRHREAAASMESALERAAGERLVSVFVGAGASSPELLRAMPRRGPVAQHAARVYAASGPGCVARTGVPLRAEQLPGARTALVDPLSARELEVLRLLRSDLSGPLIARELHVSLNTLRTHTRNIYTKLAATNRREAIRRAGELGL